MILGLVFAAAAFIAPTQATYDDMDDADFAAFVKFHDDLRTNYGEAAGKGCVGGAVVSAGGGFQALCWGCVQGAAANVATDILFPPAPK